MPSLKSALYKVSKPVLSAPEAIAVFVPLTREDHKKATAAARAHSECLGEWISRLVNTALNPEHCGDPNVVTMARSTRYEAPAATPRVDIVGVAKKVLLMDFDEGRRVKRMDLLVVAGFEVTATCDHTPSEQLPSQGQVDLVVLSLEPDHSQTVNYCEQLREEYPCLPILVLSNRPGGWGIRGSVGMDAQSLYGQVAFVLTESNQVRQVLPHMIPTAWRGMNDGLAGAVKQCPL